MNADVSELRWLLSKNLIWPAAALPCCVRQAHSPEIVRLFIPEEELGDDLLEEEHCKNPKSEFRSKSENRVPKTEIRVHRWPKSEGRVRWFYAGAGAFNLNPAVGSTGGNGVN
jgi:hypothetical protein